MKSIIKNKDKSMMQRFFLVIFFTIVSFNVVYSQELRGTWIARNSLSSKEALAYTIDSLAANNFNTVYINVWSRGYPLWQSQVFKNHVGVSIDPTYTGRDILAETIAEAHKHGLAVEAWFEYGFVGGWTGNQPVGKKGPIFDAHPNWVAKKKDGTEIDGSNFYWMIHTHKDVQDFLIELSMELVRNYDIDGIELDRIRYSGLEYGYDAYTDSLYRSEHNNSPLPSNTADPNWIRWRADKLNDFMSRIYDSIKTTNSHVNVSNAPSLYSSSSYTAYQTFCQDWAAWVNNNMIDNIQVQSYVSTSSSFGNILDYIKTLVSDYQKVYPAFAIAPNGNTITSSEIINFINVTRQKGFKGNSIWYYPDIIQYFPILKQTVYSEKVFPPHAPFDWREYYSVLKVSDTSSVKRFGTWNNSTIPGLYGSSLVASGNLPASLEYSFDVPVTGIYELYVFNVVASNRNDSAKYIVRDSLGTLHTVYVDQTNNLLRRFVKLGDFNLSKGIHTVLSVTNENLKQGRSLSADAAMIILNRRLTPEIPLSVDESEIDSVKKKVNFELEAFPNPFNSSVKINFRVSVQDDFTVKLYNLLGQELYTHHENSPVAGVKVMDMNFSNYSTGVYFLEVSQNRNKEIIKLSYVK